MTNLEYLEKDIREKLPRLMQLTEGCEFFDNTESCKIISNNGTHIDYIYDDYEKNWISYSHLIETCKVIGHQILLSDVLDWLDSKGDYYFASCGQLKERYFRLESIDGVIWDLSKPLLRDQSQELIDYLASLI